MIRAQDFGISRLLPQQPSGTAHPEGSPYLDEPYESETTGKAGGLIVDYATHPPSRLPDLAASRGGTDPSLEGISDSFSRLRWIPSSGRGRRSF